MKQFRFNYSEHFTKVLEDFAKHHSLEDRKIFKKSWSIVRNNNPDIFEKEICRIREEGYEGDIDKKIFESIRYYYRKKILKQKPKTKNQQLENKPNKLCGFSREIKQKIDIHIKNIVQEMKNLVSPATAFEKFCIQCEEEITTEVFRLKSKAKQILDPLEITIKFKKAYKNRYYKYGSK